MELHHLIYTHNIHPMEKRRRAQEKLLNPTPQGSSQINCDSYIKIPRPKDLHENQKTKLHHLI